jgi:GAF domain-containing protein
VALALESARLFEQTQIALAETEDLFRASTQLNAATSPEDVLRAITQTIAQHNVTGAALFTFEFDAHAQPEALVTLAALNSELQPIPTLYNLRYPLTTFSFSTLWLKDGAPLIVSAVAGDARLTETDRALMLGVAAYTVIPLKIGSRWIGVITLAWNRPQSFTDSDARLFASIGAQAATILDNQLLFRQTQKRAERESVINIINQRIQSATSVESAMQTAIRELGQVFKARRTIAEIHTAMRSAANDPQRSP